MFFLPTYFSEQKKPGVLPVMGSGLMKEDPYTTHLYGHLRLFHFAHATTSLYVECARIAKGSYLF
jgi:hypothetical protein